MPDAEVTLHQVVQAVVGTCQDLDSFERICEALRVGRLAPFKESQGKTLHAAAAMLWDAVKLARLSPHGMGAPAEGRC